MVGRRFGFGPKTDVATVLLRTISVNSHERAPVPNARSDRRGACPPAPMEWPPCRPIKKRPSRQYHRLRGRHMTAGPGATVSVTGNGVPRTCEMGRPNCSKDPTGQGKRPNSASVCPPGARQAAKGSARGPSPSTFKLPRARSNPFRAPALLRRAPPRGLTSGQAFIAKPAKLPGFSADRPAH